MLYLCLMIFMAPVPAIALKRIIPSPEVEPYFGYYFRPRPKRKTSDKGLIGLSSTVS